MRACRDRRNEPVKCALTTKRKTDGKIDFAATGTGTPTLHPVLCLHPRTGTPGRESHASRNIVCRHHYS